MTSPRSIAVSPLAGIALLAALAGSAPAETAVLPTITLLPALAAPSPHEPLARTAPAPANFPAALSAADQTQIECMAKVVHHEAANQPVNGQLAVAQVIMTRARSGRFPTTPCAVADQPGQFFRLASYNPSTGDARWRTAVAVSRDALTGAKPEVMAGALYFRAAYSAPNAFFSRLTRVGQIGAHVFYR